jgi:hypothetical protein
VGAAQVGAAQVGAAQVGAAQLGAGAQQLGAAPQLDLLQHLLRWHRQLWWQCDLPQPDRQPELQPELQLIAGAQQLGAGAAQLAMTGAQHVGAGAQQVGAGAQQLLFAQPLQPPPQRFRWKAMASVVLTQQNSMAAADIVIHFILNVSWNGDSNTRGLRRTLDQPTLINAFRPPDALQRANG